MSENDLRDLTVYDTATVTVSDVIDGTQEKKIKVPTSCPECGKTFGSKQGMSSHWTRTHRQSLAVDETWNLADVDPRIVAAAQAIRKPGQVILVDGPECVRVVNR